MNGATLYAAETNTECLAATTTAEFWVVIKGVISYFIFRSASFLIARCYSVPSEIRQLWIPSVRILLSLWWSHFHRVFPSNAYRRPSPPASPANWFFLSFFHFFFYIYKCIGPSGECSQRRRELRLRALAASSRSEESERGSSLLLLSVKFTQVTADNSLRICSVVQAQVSVLFKSLERKFWKISAKGSPSELVLSRRIIYSASNSNLR